LLSIVVLLLAHGSLFALIKFICEVGSGEGTGRGLSILVIVFFMRTLR